MNLLEIENPRSIARQILVRAEMWCGRNWAEAVAESQEARGANPLSAAARADADAVAWYAAWGTLDILLRGNRPVYDKVVAK